MMKKRQQTYKYKKIICVAIAPLLSLLYCADLASRSNTGSSFHGSGSSRFVGRGGINLKAFHHMDGSGYQFVMDQILALDKKDCRPQAPNAPPNPVH